MSRPDPADAARAIDVADSSDAVIVRYRGAADDVDVEFGERQIVVHAPADASAPERRSGTWPGATGEVLRRLPLSSTPDFANGRATVCDGVLTLRFPKRG
jgi:HSP20 family molecular chaperone IbpA